MVGLLDIADEGQTAPVEVRGQSLDVRGLSAGQIARLLKQFNAVQQLMSGNLLTAEQFVHMAPEAIAFAIAYGSGFDDMVDADKFKQACAKASQLTGGEQIDVAMKIFDLTFGDRLNPFVKQFMARVSSAVSGPEEAGKDDGKVLDMTSLKQRLDSLKSATTAEQFGATRPDKSPPMQNSA